VSLSLIANVIDLMETLVVGRVFNSIQFAATDPTLFSHIVKNLSLLLVITLGFWALHGPSRVLERKNAFLIRRNYRNDMFKKVLELPVEWHKDHHSGDTIDKIQKASEKLFDFSSEIFELIQNFVILSGSIIILTIFDWRISVIAIFVAIIAFASSIKFDQKLTIGYKKIFKAENFLTAGLYDYISNIISVITLRLKDKTKKEIDDRSMKAFDVFNKNSIVNEGKWFIINLYISLMTFAILTFNAYQSYKVRGIILIGTLFILYGYLNSIGRTFYLFAWKYGEIIKQNAALVAAAPINEAYAKIKAKEKFYLPKKWKTLQIKKLSFSYKANEKTGSRYGNINNISFTIRRNERIAFIGESGSGKSTAFALLRGLYEPKNSAVYCDGKKLPHGLAHLSEATTLIPQEPEIFNSTILENITMGTSCHKKDIFKSIELARFQKVVDRLDKGLNTNVMEKGVSLSGGEKQRLALARGLLMGKDSEILLMDEPTSSVDSENEKNIYLSVFEYYKDKTIISAVHRLHMLRYFDYIYFFKEGRVFTEGTFCTLLEDKNFKIIWESYNAKPGV
jgi:ABC-type multidrug transport system fused ATPase/permease subunit